MQIDLRLPEVLTLLTKLRGVRISGRSQQGVSGEGDLSAVGRNCGKRCNRAVTGELLLVRPIVIHGPDFFVAAAIRDEIDARSNQAGSAKLLQDIGGELLGDTARAGFIERSEIDF